MKRLGVFLLPPGWDASPSQGYPQHCVQQYPFIHLGGERHCDSSVLHDPMSKIRTRTRTARYGDECTYHRPPRPPTVKA